MVKREFSLYFDDKLIEKFDTRIPSQYRSKIITNWILDFLAKDAVVKKDQSNTTQPSRRKVSQ